MNVLLLSAYAARSHVHWQDALQHMFPHWGWQILSLPPRHFSWRVRGNPLYWALVERELLECEYDLLIATSMVDLATLRGLVPSLAGLPTVLYFHENQFEYPQDRQQHSLLEAQMVSLYSALAADRIVFNSRYNRESWFAGCTALLNKLPDRVPRGVVATLEQKAGVLPVPYRLDDTLIEPRWPGTSGEFPHRPLRLCWVGRFEHDKGGEGLLLILHRLEQAGLEYELALTGQQFRQSPAVFRQIETAFAHRLVQFGYLESRGDYLGLLRAADMVLSTAGHEFQGLAVMEAVALGCLPVVPGRLVYPEIYPSRFCYSSCPADPAREASSAASLILELADSLRRGEVMAPDVSAYTEDRLASLYGRLVRFLLEGQDSQ